MVRTIRHTNSPLSFATTLILLILAGEIIFSLPFHITRFFRPTFLEVFNISNGDLGDVFAVYGVVAMLSYFPGGAIADRFAPGKLMATSLLATSLGGIYLLTLPSKTGLSILFGYWGLTTILLFWAALIKGTRLIAGHQQQGKAFGLLDGGRGLTASLIALIAVAIFRWQTGIETAEDSQSALQAIILFYTCVTFTMGVLVLIFSNRFAHDTPTITNSSELKRDIQHTVQSSRVWLQGAIVVAAYCGYKSLDNYGVFAVDVLKLSELASSEMTSYLSFLRPIAAVGAGFIADRFSAQRSILVLFSILVFVFTLLFFINSPESLTIFIITNLAITSAAVYALRGVYFALLEETRINKANTGAAVGVISVVGYTPDIFFAPLAGRVLDASPGVQGFQHYFLILAIISLLGLIACYALNTNVRKVTHE